MSRARAAALAVLAALALAACSPGADTVAGQARAGDQKGYVAGDGRAEQLPPERRSTTIAVQGRTLAGDPLDTADYRGDVVVLNTWASWCGPCNAEARDLQRVHAGFAGRGVRFVGIDTGRDGVAAGAAFQRRYGITYPSLAADGGAALLQLKGKAASLPSTLVLDREGRLAARVLGRADPTVLRSMVQDVLDEGGTPSR